MKGRAKPAITPADYGSDRLRHHHRLKFELVSARSGQAMRVRVVDQTEIDRLYHEGQLTQVEHSTAERFRHDLWKIKTYGRMTSDVEPRPMSGDIEPISRTQAEAMARVNAAIRALDREAGRRARVLFITVMVDNTRVEPAAVPVIRTCLAVLLREVEGDRRLAEPSRFARRAFGFSRRWGT